MGTTADKLNKVLETKAAIKDAIVAKGVTVADTDTFASYPAKIAAISGGGAATDEWQPDPEWPDIEKIVEEDTSDYPIKIGLLYLAAMPSYSNNCGFYSNTIRHAKFSDGQTRDNMTSATVTFDESKDIVLGDGTRVRWAVLCFNSLMVDVSRSISVYYPGGADYVLYAYVKGDINASSSSATLNGAFGGQAMLQYVKINGTLVLGNNANHFEGCCSLMQTPKNLSFIASYSGTIVYFPYKNCYSLQKIEFEDVFTNYAPSSSSDLGWTGVLVLPTPLVRTKPTSLEYWFNTTAYTKLHTIPDGWDLSGCKSFNRAFLNAPNVVYAGDFNLSSNTTTFSASRSPFFGNKSLVHIRCTLPSNTNIWFDSSTVISIESFRFMADHAPDVTATPRTLTIGSTNITRCNEADPTIITDLNAKGWTVA